MKAAYYAIKAKKGCWGSLNRYEDSLITRVENADNKNEALKLFRNNEARQQYEKEFVALAPSELSTGEKEWIENYVEEIIKG